MKKPAVHRARQGVLIGLLLSLAILVAAGYRMLVWDLPDPGQISAHLRVPSIRITDRRGRLLYDILPSTGGRHTVMPLSEIALTLRQATIATEDGNFYQNPGVDLEGIARAVWINLRGGEALAGGSTITQQVARNLLMTDEERVERSLRRKLRESLLAWSLARDTSKDEILGLYLNQIYYGNLAYGVEAASQTYFGKPAAELDLAESALLAGLPQAPALYDPFTTPEAAKERQAVVLRLMEGSGAITAEQRRLAEAEPLRYNPEPYPIRAPHFVMMVREQVDALIDAEDVYQRGGIVVRTTLDLDLQAHAEAAVQHQLERLQRAGEEVGGYNVHNAALVALNPANGEIQAMVGSPDYFDAAISGAINMALAPRQPGSALKPLIYAAAFDPERPDPWTPATVLLDVRTNFLTHDGEAYTPANYDEREHGPTPVRDALGSSLNIPAVLALEKVGMEPFFQLVGKLGISTLGDPDDYDLSLALGGGEVRLLDLTAAYGALANGGMRVTPVAILDITDAQGETLFTASPAAMPRVLDPRVSWLISDILADDEARTTGFGRNSVLRLDRPSAVKTGTTTNYHDNWAIGYTPTLVAGVWAGNADHQAMREVNGLTGAAPVWHEFMRAALAGQPETDFARPEGLARAEVCRISGLLVTPSCLYRRVEWFIEGTQPFASDETYRRVMVDVATGLAMKPGEPVEQDAERAVERLALDLPAAAVPWARANNLLVYQDLFQQEGANARPSALVNDPDPVALQLITPANGATLHLSPTLPLDAQRLPIEVAAGTDLVQVTVFIDETPVKTLDQEPLLFWWPIEPGRHSIHVEALTGGMERVTTETIFVTVKQGDAD